MQNGTIIGDPANVELTDVSISLGWTPKYGRWDILPIIVSAEGEAPKWREVPSDCYKEVKITHPTLSWFEELDLRWTDHPPVSAFVISIGGIDYCAAPFSGWYLGTEVAARNLGDEHRYNALPDVGRRLGLPMNNRSLWKDRAVTELNAAVLHSFDKAKITIIE
ncbi:Nitric oxide synthase, inducible [Stygiomarasmius scandens]|uniref:Nitric oxide synthase, inducible n=1 Tax=Marasmiellus scandens TaxID=2682957 RepID=A0ABR1INF7_9AGAR